MENASNNREIRAEFLRDAFKGEEERNPNRTLTRYTPLDRFASTIEHGLFVPRATLFEDRLEGILRYLDPSQKIGGVLSPESIRAALNWIYVSCWFDSPFESASMWSTYAGKAGIAFETTETKLRVAYNDVSPQMQTYLDRVRYKAPGETDFLAPEAVRAFKSRLGTFDTAALYAALFCFVKHRAYASESEMRLVAIDPNASASEENPQLGLLVTPSEWTREMITGVILPPGAPESHEATVSDLLKRYGMSPGLVRRSALDAP